MIVSGRGVGDEGFLTLTRLCLLFGLGPGRGIKAGALVFLGRHVEGVGVGEEGVDVRDIRGCDDHVGE